MANILKIEKKIQVISMLCEGASIHGIERITGVNRNTIMNLAVRVGNACQKLMDEKMRGLNCQQIHTHTHKWMRFGDLLARNGKTRNVPDIMAMSGHLFRWTQNPS